MFFLHCFSTLLSWQGHHGTLTCQEVLVTWLLAIRNHYYYTWHSVPGSRKGSSQMDSQVAEQDLQKEKKISKRKPCLQLSTAFHFA